VAADGLSATSLAGKPGTPSPNFSLSVVPGTLNALPADALIADTDPSWVGTLPKNVTAPVAGTLPGGTFTLVPGQTFDDHAFDCHHRQYAAGLRLDRLEHRPPFGDLGHQQPAPAG
jgi:hypothetical protein